MSEKLPLYKQLIVYYRVEPGCLGPEGVNYIEDFCKFAKSHFKHQHKGIVRWVFKPRYDKSLAELEYQMKNSAISNSDAAEFLNSFNIDVDAFEEKLEEELADLVDTFFER